MNRYENSVQTTPDAVFIGAGIMSATLGALFKQLKPGATIEIYERLEEIAAESSHAWNNAGTGHAGYCELNYTPQLADGSIEISKALNIAESFETSMQLWSYFTEQDLIGRPEEFIRSTPHISFVWGDEGVSFLRKRYCALKPYPLFADMEYSEDRQRLMEWMPLVMAGRDPKEKVAATRMSTGTDINFGTLARALIGYLQSSGKVNLHLGYEVTMLTQDRESYWHVETRNRLTGQRKHSRTKFVFIGAGGGTLPLLLKSGIAEARGYGGFPVNGQWLRCTNPEIIAQHSSKVYGQAAPGAPSMTAPHFDTRIIDGQKALLFGPYAGFTTKFLKQGSWLDLPLSVKPSNITSLLAVGRDNIPLTQYLINQVRQSSQDRLNALRAFYPGACIEDWELEIAGQRVQIIKKDALRGARLEFGTEIVSNSEGSLAALLGASPGASTAGSIALNVLHKCFPDEMRSQPWQEKLRQMLLSYGQSLGDNSKLCLQSRQHTRKALKLA